MKTDDGISFDAPPQENHVYSVKNRKCETETEANTQYIAILGSPQNLYRHQFS